MGPNHRCTKCGRTCYLHKEGEKLTSPALLTKDDFCEVPLTNGGVALVSKCDYERVMQHKWYARRNHGSAYAYRTRKLEGEKFACSLHHFILETKKIVDHKDGDGLNNCRSNIRLATTQENMRNRKNKNGYPYKGIALTSSRTRPWQATITVDLKRKHLGTFETQEEAAKAYDAEAILLFGEFARLNFPPEGRTAGETALFERLRRKHEENEHLRRLLAAARGAIVDARDSTNAIYEETVKNEPTPDAVSDFQSRCVRLKDRMNNALSAIPPTV